MRKGYKENNQNTNLCVCVWVLNYSVVNHLGAILIHLDEDHEVMPSKS